MTGEHSLCFCLLSVHIKGSILNSAVNFEKVRRYSFLFIKLFSLTMSNVMMKKDEYYEGKVGLHLENVTWVNTKYGFMSLSNVLSINMVSCTLTLNCDTCTPMVIHGLTIINDTLEYYFRNDIFDLGSDPSILLNSIVCMFTTIFKTHTRAPDLMKTNNLKIILISSTFIITQSMYIDTRKFIVLNCLIQCPTAQMARRESNKNQIFYECRPMCEGKAKYSIQTGILRISEENYLEMFGFKAVELPLVFHPSPVSFLSTGSQM